MESEFITWLRDRVPRHAGVIEGIGDDAAILSGLSPFAVVTTDMLMDGVDFRVGECSAQRIGHKSLAVNLSDIAAMGADPVAAFISLALPKKGGGALARGIFDGILPLAARYGVCIAGGDTNSWDGPLVISVTLVGTRHQSGTWLRRNALPGDWIMVTGEFGGSILAKHLDFEPRVREAQFLRGAVDVHAAIDVSDGLSLDLARMLSESQGAVIRPSEIPIAEAAHVRGAATGCSPLEHALSDGEDFELIITLSPESGRSILESWPFATRISHIGEITSEPGMWFVNEHRQRTLIKPAGYQHEFDL